MDSFREEYYMDRIDNAIIGAYRSGLISLKEAQDMQDNYYSYDNLAFAWNRLAKRIDQLKSDYNNRG